ncbi:MAG TPA: hypothetical protein ENH02_02380 [Bacteroidetes bacterium]|nr:hypothetical protein [Bacteroidota bacterium]
MKKSQIWFMAMLIPLTMGLVFSGCKKDKTTECPTVDYTQLDTTISQAQQLHDNAVEGTLPGQYVEGAKADYQTAIDLAKDVRSKDCVTQQELDAAKVSLDAATQTFESQKITDVDPGALIAHWLFNGDATDATGNGNDGTPTAGHAFWGAGPAPQLTTDRFGNANSCYHFDKGSDIVVPYSTALNPSEISISLWIKMEEQPNNDYIIALDRWNGWKLNLQTSDFLFFTVKAITPDGDTSYYNRDSNPTSIDSLKWTHVVVTFKDGTMNFYVNGDLVKAWTDTPGTPIAVDNIPLSIGSDLPTDVYTTEEGSPFYVNWGGYFKGDIDDIRFYNTSLTGPQVKALYDYEKDNFITE